MEDIGKQIEDLIAKKKEGTKLPIKEKQKIILSVDDIIASKEESAKLAKQKFKDLNNSANLKEIENTLSGKKDSTKAIPNKMDSFISKKDIISQLRLAKTGHKQWIATIYVLIRIDNIEDAKSKIPVSFTACDFGKWYYGDGQMLAEFEEYQNLEKPHQKIHDIYLQIFNLYKEKIVGSLFNSEKKQLKERENKSVLLVKKLDYQSDLLFKNLLLLENLIKKVSDEKMNELNVI